MLPPVDADHGATLFLIPNLLGETTVDSSLPPLISRVVRSVKHFLVEDEKSARKIIKLLAPDINIRELNLAVLNEHTRPSELDSLMIPLLQGFNVGVISEAGCPAVADPGSDAVRRAHKLGVKVVPLVGPCSMVLALMASGLNGQSWRFRGYLPVDNPAREREIKKLDQEARGSGETQIFMDTPYRSHRLFGEILSLCHPTTLLCVAQGVTTPSELIRTHSIEEWRDTPLQPAKVPALFLLGR
jgi:16S rRNA (cytidine1402-2'-O)-methyltransferase